MCGESYVVEYQECSGRNTPDLLLRISKRLIVLRRSVVSAVHSPITVSMMYQLYCFRLCHITFRCHSNPFFLKSTCILDFCGKSSGFVDFENTVDRGSAVKLFANAGLYLSFMFRSWVLKEIWIIDLSSALVGMCSSKLFLFFE